MGRRELEAALRREGEEKSHSIWAEVEAAAERLRSETESSIEQLRQTSDERRQSQGERKLAAVIAKARRDAQRVRLDAESCLIERLRDLVPDLLTELARDEGIRMWQCLADEIPDHDWAQITVHPRDSAAAAARFPNCEIVSDEQVCGGLRAASSDNAIVIDNRLEKRLEHLWPVILPDLFRELRQRACDYEAAD